MKNTILWADDDVDDLQMMREILVKNNRIFNIVEVHNGKDALQYLHAAKATGTLPSLIILDINMPILDGKETLAQIKRNPDYQSIPIVVFTTSNSELDRMYCKRFGTEMITKPPTFARLEFAVIKLLDYCQQDNA